MKSFVVFFISIVCLILIGSLLGLLLPSKVTVAKSVVVDASAEKVLPQIADLRNWTHWYPIMNQEAGSDIALSFPDNDGKKAVLNDSAGRSIHMQITSVNKDTVAISLHTKSSTKVDYQFLLIPHKSGELQITLNVNTQFPWYPWQKMKGLFMDKMTGPQYEMALHQLKNYVESLPDSTVKEF